jgi:TrmH family RNA methyltransferase
MSNAESERGPLDHIRIVLVGTKEPGNIGSVARAMKNMGLRRLYLVDPPDHRSGDARKMAHGSGDVLYGATVCATMEEALQDTVLVVGTTHRRRNHLDVLHGPKEISRRLLALPEGTEGALVFGREENGLSNNELQLCHIVANIQTANTYPSLNLSQASLLFGYELFQAAMNPPQNPDLDLATYQEIEAMYTHITSAMDQLGFVENLRPENFLRSVRRLFGRISLEKRDVYTIHKIFRQVDKYASQVDKQPADDAAQ